MSAFNFSIEHRKGQNTDNLIRFDNLWECTCSEVENPESPKCGSCAKCITRFKEMRGVGSLSADETSEHQTEQNGSFRAISTMSQSDSGQIRQSHALHKTPIISALAKGETLPILR